MSKQYTQLTTLPKLSCPPKTHILSSTTTTNYFTPNTWPRLSIYFQKQMMMNQDTLHQTKPDRQMETVDLSMVSPW
jgi:hypothetical protein